MKPLVTVAAAALIRFGSEILLAKRQLHKNMGGLWEFPGGKLEPGESPETALIRELEEELGLLIDPMNLIPVTFVSYEYDSFYLLMLLYMIDKFEGEPQRREHAELRWVTIEEMAKLPMPPADLPLIAPLQHRLNA